MGVIKTLSDNIKRGIRSWLQIQSANPYSIQIQEIMDFELSAIRNRIWYRGDGNELEQLYQQSPESADRISSGLQSVRQVWRCGRSTLGFRA